MTSRLRAAGWSLAANSMAHSNGMVTSGTASLRSLLVSPSHPGPQLHNSLVARPIGAIPLEGRSAGFSIPGSAGMLGLIGSVSDLVRLQSHQIRNKAYQSQHPSTHLVSSVH